MNLKHLIKNQNWIIQGFLIALILLAIPSRHISAALLNVNIWSHLQSWGNLKPDSAAITPLIPYQGKLMESGTAVTGTRSMGFALYTTQSSGSPVWSEGPKSIQVVNGLFRTDLGDEQPLLVDVFDQEIWLEVLVSGTALPRQRLMGAHYALSMPAGSQVEGSKSSGSSLLTVRNTGTGQGFKVKSAGTGSSGAAIWAENQMAGNGIALWAQSQSSDTNLVIENLGSGSLIKGFGGDGGNEEFRVDNDGSIAFDGALIGAFPRPAYDSGWVSTPTLSHWYSLTHNVGGDANNYFVDYQCKSITYAWGISNRFVGTENWDQSGVGDLSSGGTYTNLSSSMIWMYRAADDVQCDQMRVRIWVRK